MFLWVTLVAGFGLALTLGIARSRAYYRAVSGKVVTEEDLAILTYSSKLRNAVHRFGEIGPILELIAVLLVMGTVVIAFPDPTFN